jgi:hypothetical protein
METFLLIVGAHDARAVCARASGALRQVIPRAGAELHEELYELPEVDGALLCLRPVAPEFRSLIDVHVDDDRAVVVFGKLTGQQRPARVVHELAASGRERSLERLRDLDGVFSTVVIDRRTRELTALTDVIGCRAPLWQERDGVLILSPHATSLVATGRVPLDWDACSVAASTCVDWSVGRVPLIKGVRTLQAFETLRWSERRARVNVATPFELGERIHRLDLRALAAHDEAVAAAMIDATRRFAQGREQITISLTRGLDSRAVLGLLHAAGAKDRLRTQTNGQPGSLDVEGASALAALCGVPHTRNEPPPPSSDDFIANARLTAFLTNGTPMPSSRWPSGRASPRSARSAAAEARSTRACIIRCSRRSVSYPTIRRASPTSS